MFPPFFSLLESLSDTDILSWIPMNPEFECRGTAVPSFTTRTLYQPPTSLIEDTCKYTDIWLCTLDIPLIILLKLIYFTFQ